MTPPTSSPAVRWFHAIAVAEGYSFLLLLFVAMPLKYMAGLPLAVKITGSLHGALFIAYVGSAIFLFTHAKWPLDRIPGLLYAAILPFGTFVMERKWLRRTETVSEQPS
jgi:integral membrane protein